MSNIIWSATKGWHDGPEVDNADLVDKFVPNAERAAEAARIHEAALRAADPAGFAAAEHMLAGLDAMLDGAIGGKR